MKILVVGGAGYIGSHMAKWLVRRNCRVTVLDDLSTGFAEAVMFGELITGIIADAALLDNLFTSRQFDAVMHFASFIQVGESVKKPAKYYPQQFRQRTKSARCHGASWCEAIHFLVHSRSL
jgi:UDP-glucose 4-epimerase